MGITTIRRVTASPALRVFPPSRASGSRSKRFHAGVCAALSAPILAPSVPSILSPSGISQDRLPAPSSKTSHRACAGIASLDVAATLSCTTRNSRRFCSTVKTLCDNLLQYVQPPCAQPRARTQPSDYRNSSRSALAALRSAVSKPSVNQS
jgi:hypothetical protein